MSIHHPSESGNDRELLYFWALGDLHYRALPLWQNIHAKRFEPMFEDLRALWQIEGEPAFCVSPGDLVETGARANHLLARAELTEHLGTIPFYTGVGNHEFSPHNMGPSEQTTTNYSEVWGKPLRYTWTVGEVYCIMLDYPDPFTLKDAHFVYISQETLDFLDTALAQQGQGPTLIFLHCPLRDTVLDRDPQQHRDYNSTQSFFSPENSQAVRAILARHPHAYLYFSGHTHTGWEAPNIVCTEQPGNHPVTFVNLMSPWYTGVHKGPRINAAYELERYLADDPDVSPTFAVRVYQDHAIIRVRDHNSKQWLKTWTVPL